MKLKKKVEKKLKLKKKSFEKKSRKKANNVQGFQMPEMNNDTG